MVTTTTFSIECKKTVRQVAKAFKSAQRPEALLRNPTLYRVKEIILVRFSNLTAFRQYPRREVPGMLPWQQGRRLPIYYFCSRSPH
jgi:hypothetical protein